MGYVLFSPIGNTDPIRGNYDGSWLHICRYYQPRVSVIYLTAEMCRKEDAKEADGRRKDIYARTLNLLNQHLFGDDAARYIRLERIRDPECEDAHSLELFFPVFRDILYKMRADYPDDEILVNVSSGTAGMKLALAAVSVLLPFHVHIIQVSDPAKGGSRKADIVKASYTVEDEFLLDIDNEPEAENRAEEQRMENLALAMRVNELCRLVEEGDYHTALQAVNSDSLKGHIPQTSKAHAALRGAELRGCMMTQEAVKALHLSGFDLDRRYGLRANSRVWQCAEYLLTMKNDLNSGAFDNFMRKLTPLLTNLCELYLAKLGKDVRKNGVNRNGRWELRSMPEAWIDVLERAFGAVFLDRTYLAPANMVPLIAEFGDARAADVARNLRDAEESVRNIYAHTIVPFRRADIERELQAGAVSGIRTPEELFARLRNLLEFIQPFPADYWQSYGAMNAHICELLKAEGGSNVQPTIPLR